MRSFKLRLDLLGYFPRSFNEAEMRIITRNGCFELQTYHNDNSRLLETIGF